MELFLYTFSLDYIVLNVIIKCLYVRREMSYDKIFYR